MTVIVNPRGGIRRGGDVPKQIQPVLMAANIDLNAVVTAHAGHAFQFAREIDLRTCDGICIVGDERFRLTASRRRRRNRATTPAACR